MVALLFIGLLLTEASSIIYILWPETEKIYYDNLYLDKTYKQPITVLYFTYELTPYIDRMIWAIVLYKVGAILSIKLAKVCIVFAVFYLTQIGFYVWNRNTSMIANYTVYTAMILILIEMLWPEKNGKLFRIE